MIRHCPVAPGGVPHVLDHDDVFQGFALPKGTIVLFNVWAIQRRHEDYDEPQIFKPERFLAHPLGLKNGVGTDQDRRTSYAFGAGRRICPGEAFAKSSLLVAMAKLLWTFNIVSPKPLDLNIDTAFQSGIALTPTPFKVDFQVRDETRILDLE